MANYMFKVKLSDESIRFFKPDGLSSYGLCDLDKFSLNYQTYELEDLIQKSLNTNLSISEICIVKEKNVEMEYSLVNNNPYIREVINYLKPKKIYRKNHLENTISIYGDLNSFNEMRDYIFNSINMDSDNFFKNIYNRPNNRLTVLLNSYVSIVKQASLNGEDNLLLREVINSIEEELRVYKTFRGFAVSRYIYESRVVYGEIKPNNNTPKNLRINKYYFNNNSYDNRNDNNMSDYEPDLYLTEDELSQMVGDGDNVKGIR